MSIACTPKKGVKDRYIITVDEEPFREIHTSIFGRNPQIKSIEELAQLEYQGARRFVLRRLAMQAYLSNALREKLEERCVTTEVANRVIAEFQDQGYLNDRDWVESFVRGQKRKKVGPQVIRTKLYQKGVPKELIDESVHSEDVTQQIKDLLEGRYRTRDLSQHKERQKVIAALCRKGFPISVILDTIQSSLKVRYTEET